MMFLTQAIYSSSFSTKLLIVQFHCKMCDFFGIFPVFKSLVQLHEIIFLVFKSNIFDARHNLKYSGKVFSSQINYTRLAVGITTRKSCCCWNSNPSIRTHRLRDQVFLSGHFTELKEFYDDLALKRYK